MKMFKAAVTSGVMLALALQSAAGMAAAGSKEIETSLAWAQMMAEAPGETDRDGMWHSHWRNEAGRLASDLLLSKLDKDPVLPAAPSAETDPNARFRAARTPEENLARTPAPKVVTGSDYVPQSRPGEPAGVTTDYARIESLVGRQTEERSSTSTVIPPLLSYGVAAPYVGYEWSMPWWKGWGGGLWSGRSGWWAGRGGYWMPPCVLAAPVYYDPYSCGGVSGGFYYRSRHVAIGVGF